MLGAAGGVIPGLMTKAGILNVPDWYVAGEVAIKDSGIPLGALVTVQLFLMGWAEAARYQVSTCESMCTYSLSSLAWSRKPLYYMHEQRLSEANERQCPKPSKIPLRRVPALLVGALNNM